MPALPKFELQKKLPLIVAIVAGLFAVMLVNSYMRQREAALMQLRRAASGKQQEKTAPVLVAKVDIPAGTMLNESMVKQDEVPEKFIQPRTANSFTRIAGRVATSPIAKGEQILLTKLALGSQQTSLAMKTPPGKRAITIPVDNIASVGGMINPGDSVDVIGTFPQSYAVGGKTVTELYTVPLFQNVLVLAVGQKTSDVPQAEGEDKRKPPAAQAAGSIITLALSPDEAALISFLQEQGKIRLVLRPPTDTQTSPPAFTNWETLMQHLFPGKDLRPKPPKIKEEPKVEVYRGLRREVVPLGSALNPVEVDKEGAPVPPKAREGYGGTGKTPEEIAREMILKYYGSSAEEDKEKEEKK